MKITREGQVIVDGYPRGWVDKYDPRRIGGRGSTWRGIREGGRTSPRRYATRAEAAEWVNRWD